MLEDVLRRRRYYDDGFVVISVTAPAGCSTARGRGAERCQMRFIQ
jgi:hypothetical protein